MSLSQPYLVVEFYDPHVLAWADIVGRWDMLDVVAYDGRC